MAVVIKAPDLQFDESARESHSPGAKKHRGSKNRGV